MARTIASSEKAQFLIFVLLIAAALIFANIRANHTAWKSTHWLFNYENGFIKRGLLGELYTLSRLPRSLESMWAFQTCIAVTSSFIFAYLVYLLCKKALFLPRRNSDVGSRIAVVSFSAMILSSPGFIQQSLFDIGRFDVFGSILLVFCVYFVMRASSLTSLLLSAAMSGVAIIIHEAFFFWIVPMCFSWWLWRHGATIQNYLYVLGAGLPLVLITFFVAESSYQDFFSFEQAKSELQARAEFEVEDSSLMVHYRDISQNIEYTYRKAWEKNRVFGLLIALLVLFPHVIFLIVASFRVIDYSSSTLLLLLFAIFSPTFLFALGHDQGRWIAMIFCSIGLTLLCVVDRAPHVFDLRPIRWASAFIFITLVQSSLGPLGVTRIFPEAGFWQAIGKLLALLP